MSYTIFEISNHSVANAGDRLTVTATVKNTGKTAGAEVVQVYVNSKDAVNGDDRPVKQLKGFKRVELNPGEKELLRCRFQRKN